MVAQLGLYIRLITIPPSADYNMLQYTEIAEPTYTEAHKAFDSYF